MIDEHAGELVAHGAMDDQRRDRRVDAARQPADDARVADPRAHVLDLLGDDRGRAPGPLATADLVEEVLEDLRAVRRVHDLGMELDPVEAPGRRLEGGDRRGRRGRKRREAGRRLEDGVAVAHPAALLVREPVEQPAGLRDAQLGTAELADIRALDATTQLEGHRLHAVADAERGKVELEQLRAQLRRPLVIDRGGASRQHEPARLPANQPRRAADRVAGAPRTRRTRGSVGRSAVSTGPRSRAPGPLGQPAFSRSARRSPSRRAPYSSSSLTAAATCALPFEPMPTCCSRWSCLPSLWSAGAIITSARWNEGMSS